MASTALLFSVLLSILYAVATIRYAAAHEEPAEHGRPDAPRRRTDSSLHAAMSPREINTDHLWSLTIPVASTGSKLTPKLTPKVTPYGADARAIPGHPWKRESANSSAKCAVGHHRTRVDRRKPSF